MNTAPYWALSLTLPLATLVSPALGEDNSATAPASALVKRVTPAFARKVNFRINPKLEKPLIEGRGSSIRISAPHVRECIRAYGYYLRSIANIHFSWNGNNTRSPRFVVPTGRITVPEALPFNYALNYCTYSYTCTHWDKERWSHELDMMALNGFRYVLVTPGLEKVWQGFLKDLDYPDDKAKAFIPHPCYAAWWNMGNLEGEGGPVSQSLIDSEAELGRFIVSRLRELGMEPVLQGYVGFLPHDFPGEGINGKILPQGQWCGYQRPAVLQPTSEAFPGIAALWYKHLHQVYGASAHAYCGDLFHEGGRKGDTQLAPAAKAIQAAMQKASPASFWFLQAWGGNPARELLEGTDPQHTIILELNKDLTENAGSKARNYAGRPYIWCELANFGGNQGLFGGAALLENLSGDAGGAVGLGLLSEGLETNPFYYALLYERLNNRAPIHRAKFIHSYASARYGCTDSSLLKAIKLLADTVYKPDRQREGCLENIMCARPSLSANKASTWSDPTPYYNAKKVEEAASLFLQAGKKAGKRLTGLPTWQYDMADLCRQVLADRARRQLPRCKAAFDARDKAAFRRESEAFLQLIRDEEQVLATSEFFLLGRFLEGARKRAATPADQDAMERNLRRLITTWRPDTGVLNDYAHRQFSEMMGSYYLLRWKAYFDSRMRELEGTASTDEIGIGKSGVTHNNGTAVGHQSEKNPEVDALEKAFPTAEIKLLHQPTGNIVTLAGKLLAR